MKETIQLVFRGGRTQEALFLATEFIPELESEHGELGLLTIEEGDQFIAVRARCDGKLYLLCEENSRTAQHIEIANGVAFDRRLTLELGTN